MKLTALTFGWEFPPHNLGGLGVACEGLVRGLTNHGVRILMVLPRQQTSTIHNCTIIAANEGPLLHSVGVASLLQPYITSHEYTTKYKKSMYESGMHLYGEHIFAEVERYAAVAQHIIKSMSFDIIHAHDWMSMKAGVIAKQLSGKPLVVHIHATEFDRTGGNGVNQYVYDIERWGMEQADNVIVVSEFTKQKVIRHYSIHPDKITVMHNAISPQLSSNQNIGSAKKGPLVLFLGRLTLQKGPDYFIRAAEQVLRYRDDITFVVVGAGDMEQRLIEWVATIGLSDKILFTGRLRGSDVNRMYQMADLFVMPSVSEPFGLTALEAMQNGTPVILSKQSGVSEVISHCLRVDFWDINEMVSKIISVLDHSELHKELVANGNHEIQKFSWDHVAQKCINLYQELCSYA